MTGRGRRVVGGFVALSWWVGCLTSSPNDAPIPGAADGGFLESGPGVGDATGDQVPADGGAGDVGIDADSGAAVVVDGGLASCCEIFPVFTPADSGADADPYSPNPLSASFGTVAVGKSVALSLRYYNACGAPGLSLTGVRLEAEGGASAFVVEPASPIGTPIQGASQAEVVVRFQPTVAGALSATLIVETSNGYYVTKLAGVGAT